MSNRRRNHAQGGRGICPVQSLLELGQFISDRPTGQQVLDQVGYPSLNRIWQPLNTPQHTSPN